MPEIEWGYALCAYKCMRPADVLLDGLPLCIPCADATVDRANALGEQPSLRQILHPLERGAWEQTH